MSTRETIQNMGRYVTAGFIILLAGAYLDNIRGPLLPIIADDLGINYATTSWFLVAGHATSAVMTFLLLLALNRWSDGAVTIAVCLIAAISTFFGLLVVDLSTMIVFAMLLGASVSTAGTMSNVLAIRGAREDKISRVLLGLHIMYGLGSLVAPLVVRELIDAGWSWRSLTPLACVGLLPVIMLSASFKSDGHSAHSQRAQTIRINSLQALMLATFGFYVTGEVLSSMWLVTYLVGDVKMSVVDASLYSTYFFAVMAISRLFCFALFKPRYEKIILWLSLALPTACFALAHTVSPVATIGIGLFGPFFPLFLGRVSRTFPTQWRSLTVWVIVIMQIMLAGAHLFLGNVADLIGISYAYMIPPIFLVLAALLLAIYFRAEPRTHHF